MAPGCNNTQRLMKLAVERRRKAAEDHPVEAVEQPLKQAAQLSGSRYVAPTTLSFRPIPPPPLEEMLPTEDAEADHSTAGAADASNNSPPLSIQCKNFMQTGLCYRCIMLLSDCVLLCRLVQMHGYREGHIIPRH